MSKKESLNSVEVQVLIDLLTAGRWYYDEDTGLAGMDAKKTEQVMTDLLALGLVRRRYRYYRASLTGLTSYPGRLPSKLQRLVDDEVRDNPIIM